MPDPDPGHWVFEKRNKGSASDLFYYRHEHMLQK